MINEKLRAINAKFYPKYIVQNPKWIVLGVNNVCNLHCKMCDVGTQNLETNFAQNLVGSHPLNMPLDLIKRLIDQTSEYYPNAKLGYAFTEPLVYPHLKESLLYANEKGLDTTITTNALNLRRKADDILEGKVFLSMDFKTLIIIFEGIVNLSRRLWRVLSIFLNLKIHLKFQFIV